MMSFEDYLNLSREEQYELFLKEVESNEKVSKELDKSIAVFLAQSLRFKGVIGVRVVEHNMFNLVVELVGYIGSLYVRCDDDRPESVLFTCIDAIESANQNQRVDE